MIKNRDVNYAFVRSKAARDKSKKAEKIRSEKVEKIDRLNDDLSFLSKRLTRRQAISSGLVAGVGVAGLVVGGLAGYYLTGAAPGAGVQTMTSTVTSTVTTTAASTATVSPTAVSTTSAATAGTLPAAGGQYGPGVDYYWDPSLKGTTVNWLCMGIVEETPVFNNLKLFTQETGITVNLTVESEPDVDAKASTVFATGSSMYDLIDTSAFGAFAFADYAQGYILPLNKFVDMTPSGWKKDDIFPIVAQALTYPDGSITSFPIVFVNSGMWYSISALQAAGVAVPLGSSCQVGGTPTPGRPPTWDQMMPIISKMHNPPQQYGWLHWTDPPLDNVFTSEHWIWAKNKNWLTKDYTSNFTDPDVIASIQDYVTLSQKYVPELATFNVGPESALATAGHMAAGFGLSIFPTYFSTGSTLTPDKWLYSNFPAYEGGANPTFAAAATMVINKNAKNAAGAWSLMSWFTSPRVQNFLFGQAVGTIRSSVPTAPSNMASTDPAIQVGRQSIGWFSPPTQPVGTPGAQRVYCPIGVNMPRAFELMTIIGTELSKAMGGQETAAQACSKIDSGITPILNDVGFANKRKYAFGS